MFNKIAVMGCGSMGTILGAFITKAGKDVTLIDANKAHVDMLNEKGAKCTGYVDFTVPVKALTPDQVTEKFDLILFMSKQTYNDVAIPQMISFCHENTIICALQNGIPEYAVIKAWPAEKVCGAPMGWGAVWQEPGVSKMINPLEVSNFHLGTLDGSTPDWLFGVKEVLECMCPTIVSEDLMADRWAKLLINAAFSGMSAVLGCDYGGVFDDPIGSKAATWICKETVEVSKAAGVKMVPFVCDYVELCKFTDEEGFNAATKAIAEGFETRRGTVASMLQDLKKGLKCEVPQLDGLVAEVGDQYGIDTPVTDMVVEIVRDIEAGKETYGMHNAKKFEAVLPKF